MCSSDLLKQADIDVIKRAMVAVTHNGTAARVFAGAAYESAGKTGTAQTYTLGKNEKYNHHAIDDESTDDDHPPEYYNFGRAINHVLSGIDSHDRRHVHDFVERPSSLHTKFQAGSRLCLG